MTPQAIAGLSRKGTAAPRAGQAFLAITLCALLCSSSIKTGECAQADYTAGNLRDPFQSQLPRRERPAVIEVSETEEAVVAPALRVESLISGGPMPQAIIAGRIFRVGDTVEEALITQIVKDGVEILYKGKVFWLPAPSRLIMEKIQAGETAEKTGG